MNIVIEEVHKRRELEQVRDLYIRILDARPTAVPERLGRDLDSQILVAKDPRSTRIVGGLSINRNHNGVRNLARTKGPEYAIQWANEYPLITHLAVSSDYQGQRVGSALLKRAVELAKYRGGKRIWGFAEVHDERASAAFYERNGFTIEAAETGTFKLGEVRHPSSAGREGEFFFLDLDDAADEQKTTKRP